MGNQTNTVISDLLVRVPEKSWWARLPFGVRMSIGGVATAGFLVGGGYGVAALVDAGPSPAAIADGPPPPVPTGVVPTGSAPLDDALGMPLGIRGEPPGSVATGDDVPVGAAAGNGHGGADGPGGPMASGSRGGSRPPGQVLPAPGRGSTGGGSTGGGSTSGGPTSGDAPGGGPTTGTRTVVENHDIPFDTRTVEDATMPRGSTRVWTEGEPGLRTLRYAVTIVDGRETGRRLLDDTVTRQPVTRVVAVGTAPDADGGCGADDASCAPPSPDPDCSDGSGGGGGSFGGTGAWRVFWHDVYVRGDGYGCD